MDGKQTTIPKRKLINEGFSINHPFSVFVSEFYKVEILKKHRHPIDTWTHEADKIQKFKPILNSRGDKAWIWIEQRELHYNFV